MRPALAPAAAFAVCAAVAAAGVGTNLPLTKLAAVVFGLIAIALTYRWALRWQSLVMITVLVILWIPIRRYTLPSSLPFQLEPYRLIVAFVALAWFTSLLIDPKVRLRRTGMEGPFAFYIFVAIVSMLLNPGRVAAVSSIFTKTVMFTASYFVLVYLLASVLNKRENIDLIVRTLVGGGSVVAIAAIVQSRTGFNPFDHLSKVFPVLRLGALPFQFNDLSGAARGGRLRAYASAEHPIALGAAFVMLMPLALYLANKTRQRRWWLCALLLMLGLFATVSRTGFLMLIVSGVIMVAFRRREAKRYWPALLPAVVLIHFAVPGTFGTMIQSFFPKGGLIAQQTNQSVGSGRLATLGPVLRSEFLPHPLFGEGFGTRLSGDNGVNVKSTAPILDDEWAGVLVETGVFGAFAFAWIFIRAFRMLGRWAGRRDDDGWLALALAASIGGFGVGMFTFDALSFIQTTFIFYFLLALAGALRVRLARAEQTAPLHANAGLIGARASASAR